MSPRRAAQFRPKPLLPPKLGVPSADYIDYLRSYDLYLKALSGFRTEFWKTANDAKQGVVKQVAMNLHNETSYEVYNVKMPDARPELLGSKVECEGYIGEMVPGRRSYYKIRASRGGFKLFSEVVKTRPPVAAVQPAVLSEAALQAREDRRRAARKRRRQARSVRDAVEKHNTITKVQEARLVAAKTQADALHWTEVVYKRSRQVSRLPVAVKPFGLVARDAEAKAVSAVSSLADRGASNRKTEIRSRVGRSPTTGK